jgi:DNA-binding transcriptional MerR regulator
MRRKSLSANPAAFGGRRDYSEEVFSDFQVVRMALESGFTISQAQTLIHGFSGVGSPSLRWRALTRQKLKDVRTRIDQLQHAEKLLERAASCRCMSLNECATLLLNMGGADSEVSS